MLKEMLTGYKTKDRFRELSDTYNFKRRNVELRQSNDRELQYAQDQVDKTTIADCAYLPVNTITTAIIFLSFNNG